MACVPASSGVHVLWMPVAAHCDRPIPYPERQAAMIWLVIDVLAGLLVVIGLGLPLLRALMR